MDPIWTLLPNDLARHIINFSDDLDVRVAFGCKPRRLVINNGFNFRSEFVYDKATKTMFDFSGMSDPTDPYWVIRRGIPFSHFRSPGLHIFNMEWRDYDMTLFETTHQVGPSKCQNHLVVNKRVKFK
jgi:hypothetical protein